MLRPMLLASITVLSVGGCTEGDSPIPTSYRTDGTATLEVCKGAGIEKCNNELAEVPELIDLRDPDWSSLRSERKSSTWTMCYLDLPGGLFTKRKLMFDCEPIYEPLSDGDVSNSVGLRDALMKSLANMAEAAATFDVCADYYVDDAETSLAWTGHSIALASGAERMTAHNNYPEMLLAFEVQRSQLGASEEFQSETREYMSNCDAESLAEAGEYIRQNEQVIARYLSN